MEDLVFALLCGCLDDESTHQDSTPPHTKTRQVSSWPCWEEMVSRTAVLQSDPEPYLQYCVQQGCPMDATVSTKTSEKVLEGLTFELLCFVDSVLATSWAYIEPGRRWEPAP